MTFGAMAAWQAWLLIAAAVTGAVLVFFVKVRPPRLVVPSLLLWRLVLDHPRDVSWWERVRKAVSLVVTAAVALALALAVGDPGPRVTGGSTGRVLIMLDSSWSMRARTADGQTRWQHAVDDARTLVTSGAAETFALATTADGIVEGPTGDPGVIHEALDRVSPSGAADRVWPIMAGAHTTHFFTDGALARRFDPTVVVHPAFEPAANVAITAFGSRQATSAMAAPSAYLEVANYSERPQTVRVTVTRGAAVVLDRQQELAAREVRGDIIDLTSDGGARLRAHVSADDDALDVDNDAVAWLRGAEPLEVLVVSEAPAVLSNLLRFDPTLRVAWQRPGEFSPPSAGVVVFDGWAPSAAPSRPSLYINPPSADFLGVATDNEIAPRWVGVSRHPVLAGVDPQTFDVGRARRYEGPALEAVARSERGTPLVSILDSPAARAVVFGFAMTDSNLAMAPAFPVLIGNTLQWLGSPSVSESRPPGLVVLPASTTRVTAPDGSRVPFVRSPDGALARLRTSGLHLVEATGARSVVAVNAGHPDTGDLSRTHLADAEATAEQRPGRPWWIYAVWVAFALLFVEWWTWQRRITV